MYLAALMIGRFFNLKITSENDKDDIKDVKMDFLDNILIHIISEIKLNRICVYMTNSKFHDEYNIVRWDLLPYNIQEGKKKRDFNWRSCCKNNKI